MRESHPCHFHFVFDLSHFLFDFLWRAFFDFLFEFVSNICQTNTYSNTQQQTRVWIIQGPRKRHELFHATPHRPTCGPCQRLSRWFSPWPRWETHGYASTLNLKLSQAVKLEPEWLEPKCRRASQNVFDHALIFWCISVSLWLTFGALVVPIDSLLLRFASYFPCLYML